MAVRRRDKTFYTGHVELQPGDGVVDVAQVGPDGAGRILGTALIHVSILGRVVEQSRGIAWKFLSGGFGRSRAGMDHRFVTDKRLIRRSGVNPEAKVELRVGVAE